MYLYETYSRCFHCNNCKKKNTTYFIIRKYLIPEISHYNSKFPIKKLIIRIYAFFNIPLNILQNFKILEKILQIIGTRTDKLSAIPIPIIKLRYQRSSKAEFIALPRRLFRYHPIIQILG